MTQSWLIVCERPLRESVKPMESAAYTAKQQIASKST